MCFPNNFENKNCTRKFFEIGGIPSVCGVIDGTLIKIKCPSTNEEQFTDRHGSHSLNIMLVSGPDNVFYYCNSSWPGSVNDARVLRNSNLFYSFNSGYRPFPASIILGDSIYPCLDWLIPPVLGRNLDVASEHFNHAHRKTRSVVERSIDLLKMRFQCLKQLRINSPVLAAEIVKACVTLHNLCISTNDSFSTQLQEDIQIESEDEHFIADDILIEQRQDRKRQLIHHFTS